MALLSVVLGLGGSCVGVGLAAGSRILVEMLTLVGRRVDRTPGGCGLFDSCARIAGDLLPRLGMVVVGLVLSAIPPVFCAEFIYHLEG